MHFNQNLDALKFHCNQQLDKLAANGFIEFKPDQGETAVGGATCQANLTGNGAIALGKKARAAGQRGLVADTVGENIKATLRTGLSSIKAP